MRRKLFLAGSEITFWITGRSPDAVSVTEKREAGTPAGLLSPVALPHRSIWLQPDETAFTVFGNT